MVTLREVLRLIRVLKRIKKLNLEKDIKGRISETYLKTFFLRRFDRKKRVAKVAGYHIKFCTFENLSFLFDEIFLNQEYCFVSKNKEPFIVDCGSNIGMSVLYFKIIHPKAEILAFEPDDEAFSCLKENVNVNRLDSISINRKALSNTEGKIDFYYESGKPGSLIMSTIPERIPKQEKKEAESGILSVYINKEVDFLKMDVEGAELTIVEELANKGKLKYINQMAIEYHHHVVKETDLFGKILRILEKTGFGYQIETRLGRPLRPKQFQNIFIYAYRKK